MSGTTWAYFTVSLVVAGPGFSKMLRLTGFSSCIVFS
jgi:hypothetical protein